MTYHQLCIVQSCAEVETGPVSSGRGGQEREMVLHRRGSGIMHVYANAPKKKNGSHISLKTLVQVCSQTGFSCNVWNVLSVYVKIHFRAIFNFPNRQRHECTLSMITIRWSESQWQYAGSVRKLGVGTRLRICKDSCRCQGHHLHGYRILQHQVQIKFLEAPLASLVFPRIQGLWRQKPWVNNNTGELAAAVASALSRLAFFIICRWPTTKLHCLASWNISFPQLFTRSVLLWMYNRFQAWSSLI